MQSGFGNQQMNNRFGPGNPQPSGGSNDKANSLFAQAYTPTSGSSANTPQSGSQPQSYVQHPSWIQQQSTHPTGSPGGVNSTAQATSSLLGNINNPAFREVQKLTSNFEDIVDRVITPVKPYLGVIARFLLVVTFLEDSLRMITQWPEQSFYLRSHRGFPWIFPEVFLISNIVCMSCASFLCIVKKHTEYACAVLFGVIFIQSLGYGLIFDFQFCARTLSVVGGLVIMVADAYSSKSKKFAYIAGLPGMVAPGSRLGAYLQLLGRVLLVGLFLSFILNGEWSLLRFITAIIAGIGCVMIVVGFKAKMTSVFLVAFLSITNVMLNNYWTLDHFHPSRDFQKYDFFQTLSVMGGFLLLSNLGAGDLSVDEKKKSF